MADDEDKILIHVVTGSDFLNETLKKILTNQVCDVCCISDGLQSIKMIYQRTPSLIFIDMNLDGFQSVDTLKVISKLPFANKFAIVCMLVPSQISLLAEIIKLGVSSIVYKPITKSDVLQVVCDLIGEKIKKKMDRLSKQEMEIVQTNYERTCESMLTEKQKKSITLNNFLPSIDNIKVRILKAEADKNVEELLHVYNDIEPVGKSIGYPRLTLISDFLNRQLSNNTDDLNWIDTDSYIIESIKLLEQIKYENYSILQ